MSNFSDRGWYYLPEIITKEEAIQIKYQNLCGAMSDLGSLEGHWFSIISCPPVW